MHFNSGMSGMVGFLGIFGLVMNFVKEILIIVLAWKAIQVESIN